MGIIKESTINFPNYTALSVQEVSQVELEDSSTVNGRISVYNKSFLDAVSQLLIVMELIHAYILTILKLN